MSAAPAQPRVRPGRALVWVLLVAAAGAALDLLGRGPLRGPALLHPGGWASWVRLHGAVDAAFVILRLLSLAAAAYSLVITMLGLLVGMTPRRLPYRLFAVVALPGLRRFLEGTLSLGLAATVIAGPTSSFASPRPLPVAAGSAPSRSEATAPPVLRLLAPQNPAGEPPVLRLHPAGSAANGRPVPALGAASSPPASPRSGTGGAGASARSGSGEAGSGASARSGEGAAGGGSAGASSAGAGAAGTGAAGAGAPARSGEAGSGVVGSAVRAPTWVLRPGDSLWHVAEATVTRAWGRPPPEEIVGHYWWAVVTVNRPRLPDPANPDLVFPGEVITLPPPPQP